jgi:hypothetical protein
VLRNGHVRRRTVGWIAVVGCGVAHGAQHRARVAGAGLLGLAEVGQRRFDQRLHLVEVGVDPVPRLCVVQKPGVKAQAGDGCAQIVGDGAQCLGAILHQLADALLRCVEGARRCGDAGETGHARSPEERPCP